MKQRERERSKSILLAHEQDIQSLIDKISTLIKLDLFSDPLKKLSFIKYR